MEALNESGAVPNAPQMIDGTVIRAHHQAAGARGDSATGFRALKRWLHDQDPPPRQRAWSAHEDRNHAGPGPLPRRFDPYAVEALAGWERYCDQP